MGIQMIGRLAVVTALFAFNASAVSFGGVGGGFDIDDNATDSSDVVIVGAATSIDSVSVTLNGLSHTWVGDLQVSLTGPNAASIDLMSCTGATLICVNAGDSSDLDGDYTFADGGADWWAAAAAAAGGDVVPAGTYAPTDSSNIVLLFSTTFGGIDPNGTWTLSITDRTGGDTGILEGWTLSGEASTPGAEVPEPGTISLLGLSLLGMAAYRRRRA